MKKSTHHIPTLHEIVDDSIDFFIENPPPIFDISRFSLPFVVGSGNAINTGKILFSEKAAIFADESNFKSQLTAYKEVIKQHIITHAVIISASGEKDSVWEVELAKSYGLHTTLLTCSPRSTAASIADEVIVYQSISEPYTYNTSTYLGMILSVTQESPKQIKSHLRQIMVSKQFFRYTSYAFLLPDKYLHITPMISIKSDELFGPHMTIRAYTHGHARHAKFVHPTRKELVISLGEKNNHFGHKDHRFHIDLPAWTNYGTVVSLSYYLCGLIQSQKKRYFHKNIHAYCTDHGPKAYGKTTPFDVIVAGNKL